MPDQPPDQPTITLNDGTAMPQLGLGVFQVPPPEAQRLVRTALEVGYKAVDTAAFYENEEGVGAAVRERDDWIFVTTKLWVDALARDAALKAFDQSMAKLGLEKLDLYLIHWPAPARELYVEAWKALIELRDQGRVTSIGVSNFTPAHLERIIGETGVVPAVNQIELHPSFQQRDARAFHAAHGIATQSWSPLGRGAGLGDPAIARIAAKHGKSSAQTILRWHLDAGLIVIPKTSSRERLIENLDVFDFTLDAADMAAIEALDRPDGRIGPDPEVLGG